MPAYVAGAVPSGRIRTLPPSTRFTVGLGMTCSPDFTPVSASMRRSQQNNEIVRRSNESMQASEEIVPTFPHDVARELRRPARGPRGSPIRTFGFTIRSDRLRLPMDVG